MNMRLFLFLVVAVTGVAACQTIGGSEQSQQTRPTQTATERAEAKRLDAVHRPALEAALAGLDAVSWPAPEHRWGAIREALDAARGALAAYRGARAPADLNQLATRLRKRMAALETPIRRDAVATFTAYDHFAGTSFFEAFPAEVDAAAFMGANIAAIRPRLEAVGTRGLGGFAETYPPDTVLDATVLGALGRLYVAAFMAEQGGAADMETRLRAVTSAAAAGFRPEGVPGMRIGFVEATSKTLLKQGQIDFRTAVDLDLPFETGKLRLDEAFTMPMAEAPDLIIVFNVALAKANRKVRDLKRVRSRFLAGCERIENAEWEIARAKVSTLRSELAELRARNTYGWGGLLPIGEAAVEKKIKIAEEEFRNTPRYVKEPIYERYSIEVARVEADKAMTVNYHVIDRKAGRHYRSTFDIIEEQGFRIAYNVHPDDTNKRDHYAVYDKERDVVDWEDASVAIRLSSLLDDYLSNRERARKFKNLAALRRQILRDTNVALSALRKETFGYRKGSDPRIESVVAVYTGKGSMGSGFYILPDVVLTNWHVVDKSKFVEMKRFDRHETFGRVMVKDVRLDLALIKVQERGVPVRFRTRRTVDLGATVEAIGHPFRREFSITRGIVSTVREEKSINLPRGGGEPVLYIQTDAPTNPGNSGGPLFLGDEVIGVNTMGIRADVGEGQNFAVHYSEILRFIEETFPGYRARMAGKEKTS
jgi:serine protease Do